MTTLQLFLAIGLPILVLCATILVGLLFNRRGERNSREDVKQLREDFKSFALRDDLKQMEIRLTALIQNVREDVKLTETRIGNQITTLGDRLLAVERKTGTR